jgi:hypothetical protein
MRTRIHQGVLWVGLVLLLVLALGGPPAEAGIVVVSRDSSVHHEGAVNDPGGIDPLNPPFDVTHGTFSTVFGFADVLDDISLSSTHVYSMHTGASQISSIGYSGYPAISSISGIGDAMSIATGSPPPPGGGWGNAHSFFDVFFDVTWETTTVHLEASVTGSGPAGPDPIGRATFDLIHVGTGTLVHLASTDGGTYSYVGDLDLSVGSYELVAKAETSTTSAYPTLLREASWSVSLVPEPAGLTLLSLPILILARRRR